MEKMNARKKAARAARLRKQRTRRALLTLCLMLAVALVSIGGTIAWLVDETTPVTNTFTPSDIDISLTEENDGPYKLVPGKEYKKDPIVAVEDKTDVDVYLFVKFEEKNNPATYLTYTSTLTTANGWTQGDGTDIPANVWYREVKTTETTKSWHLLDSDKITVKDTVTKGNMASADDAQLVYTAYAIQMEGFNAKNAWAEVSK